MSKLPDVGVTIFTVMSKMAADASAINLSQGYPDFEVPAELKERLNHYVNAGENQYPPMQGLEYLRQQISNKVKRCYGVMVDAGSEVTVTSGATEALFVAIQAMVNRDDEVIVFDPVYDSYEPAVTLAGGKTIHIPLTTGDYRVDWQRVRETITDRTRLIILNSPHNPTGAILSLSDLDELADIIRDRDIHVVSDEVYEHMVFDDELHHSLISHAELRMKCFVVSSFGKTYHATGWKVGYAIAPPNLTDEFRKVHQFVTFTTHTPTQWAIADFLEHHPEHDEQLAVFYQAKRDLFIHALKGSGFEMIPSAGTYFQMADYGRLSATRDTEFVEVLTRKAGVAAIPVSVLQTSPTEAHVIRFCFAKQDETLLEAADQLKRYFS